MKALEKKQIYICPTPFMLISGDLYKLGREEVLFFCVLEHEHIDIMEETHGGITGGHYAGDVIAWKIVLTRLWWKTLYKYCKAYCKACDHCQHLGKPRQRDEMPLRPISSAEPFKKWVIEIIGPISLAMRMIGLQYIITCTNYLTMWAKATPLKDCTAATTTRFLWQNDLTQYGCPLCLTSDRGTHFLNETIRILLDEFMIMHHNTTPYHPQ